MFYRVGADLIIGLIHRRRDLFLVLVQIERRIQCRLACLLLEGFARLLAIVCERFVRSR
jgi:hypothetical protein